MSPEKKEESSPEPEKPLLTFQVPPHHDLDIYLIQLPDGTIVARTKEELEKAKPLQTPKGKK